jgi:hypothetical protein
MDSASDTEAKCSDSAAGKPDRDGKIRGRSPQEIITDCMSCSLQFSHELPYPVFHPMEILSRPMTKRM